MNFLLANAMMSRQLAMNLRFCHVWSKIQGDCANITKKFTSHEWQNPYCTLMTIPWGSCHLIININDGENKLIVLLGTYIALCTFRICANTQEILLSNEGPALFSFDAFTAWFKREAYIKHDLLRVAS